MVAPFQYINGANELPEAPKKAAVDFKKVLFAVNTLIQRREAFLNGPELERLGNLRNIDKQCSYPVTIGMDQYLQMWHRIGYARRVVSLYPTETWSTVPLLEEKKRTPEQRQKNSIDTSPWEKSWERFLFKHNPWHYCYRADLLCGLGQFGGIYLGWNDGRALDQPVPEIDGKTGESKVQLLNTTGKEGDGVVSGTGRQLLFMRPFSQAEVTIEDYEKEPTSPRYGLPVMYSINFSNPESLNKATSSNQEQGTRVHWTRFLHIADNLMSSEIFGIPRLQQVYNDLLNLRKICGGSAEMLWGGGFPGLAFEQLPDSMGVTKEEIDWDELDDEVREYYNEVKRYIAVLGMQVKTLTPQVADPTPHIMAALQEITCALEVPMRIFMGSETGHLASTQDIGTWNKRVGKRQKDFVNPKIIKPLVQRLMDVGILPMIDLYHIDWEDLNALTDSEKADIGLKRAQTVMSYVSSGSESLIPAYYFLTTFMHFSPDDANAIVAMLDSGDLTMFSKVIWEMTKPGLADATKKTNVQNNGQGSVTAV